MSTGARGAAGSRLAFVDGLKAGASQLIVLHHLAFYGPMSDAAAPLAPALVGWLSEYARIAVQVFLVTGGFLGARALAPGGVLLTERPLQLLLRRYVRLVVPFGAALVLAVVMAAIARDWMSHDSIPAPPGWLQFAAHLLLLHDLLDYEALTAGAWYVAIDLQLFVLMTLLLWLARGPVAGHEARRRLGIWLVAAFALASLFHFNRDPRWDESALYFFGAYAMGAFAWWLSQRRDALAWTALLVAGVGAALALDFRMRIAVALAVTLALAISFRGGGLACRSARGPIAFLGRIGYSVFLVHFPVMLVIGAWLRRFVGADPWANALGIALAWSLSVAVGALFHRLVEQRVSMPADRPGSRPVPGR
jgi:peptidoglycan/LPS O-acetylase OafA/YrhL